MLKLSQNKHFSQFFSLYFSLALSLLWVIFFWGFWEKGIYALGINIAFFYGVLFGYWHFVSQQDFLSWRKNWKFLVPLISIVIGLSLYENPFLKYIDLILFPFLCLFFWGFSQWENIKTQEISLNFLWQNLGKSFGNFIYIGEAIGSLEKLIKHTDTPGAKIAKKILLGLGILILASLVIVPILSSADDQFAEKISHIIDWFGNIFSWDFVTKSIIFLFLLIFFLTFSFSDKSEKLENPKSSGKFLDGVTTGIVLIGILGFYFLFIFLQIDQLFTDGLPTTFAETEKLVKNGFWQLIFLSALNILVFLFIHKKSDNWIEKILGIFVFSSLLILISAGQKMFLYVFYHGLSYEKFFAAFAVIYCLFVFVILFLSLSGKIKFVLKYILGLCLWMYGVVHLLPVEKIIWNTNSYLVTLPESRVEMSELVMLSGDVLNEIKGLGVGERNKPLFDAYKITDTYDKDDQVFTYSEIRDLQENDYYSMSKVSVLNSWKDIRNWNDKIREIEMFNENRSWYEKPLFINFQD